MRNDAAVRHHHTRKTKANVWWAVADETYMEMVDGGGWMSSCDEEVVDPNIAVHMTDDT